MCCRIIQFGTHYFPQVPSLTERYCKIRSDLNMTHHMVYGVAFGWERWDRRDIRTSSPHR